MNWTGGTLQRTKNAKKGVVQKQRAYFARARTKLQQSPGTPAAPFRPDFLQEGDDYRDANRASSFASGSVHSTRHLARKRRAREERHEPSTARRQGHLDGQRRPKKASPHFGKDTFGSIDEREERRETRRKYTAVDSETQLLEANKRRHLKQQDWVGLTASKPVSLQYSSAKERTWVGKRRKLDGKTRASIRRSPVTFLHRSGQNELEGHHDAFMSGALPVLAAADNIRVRVGSDALTTVASTQPINYAPSQTNSDSLLFDEEVNGAAKRQGSEMMTCSGHKLAPDPRYPVDRLAEYDRSCSPQHGPTRYHNLTRRPAVHADERMRHAAGDSNALNPANLQSEATGPSYRLTHFVGGIERPFKLTFGGRSTDQIDHAASPTRNSVDTQHGHANLYAGGIETGNAPRNVGKAHETAVRRQPNPPLIDDDEPWMPYLDRRISSSGHARMDYWTGTSVLQPHVLAHDRGAEGTLRPQLTHANLLTVSASLPAPKQQSARLLDARPLPRADALKGFRNDEAFWKSCAIGSDPHSAVETIHTHDEASERSTSWATKGYASTRLPLSTAVTSVSSTPFPATPFKSLSGQVSRISDEV
ncbi:hypothetical protein SVAN01_01248 [Stagonosporopsis vannaccii]|nr:hypothetical protein SVAN01_01248 [Stagonosporopsis vannaccii]